VTATGHFLGWRALHLDNGIVRAVIVPDIGGRVLQFWLADHPYLFVNEHLAGRLFTPDENWGDGTISSWKNYGGNKTWPAPQGWDRSDQWPGPPDPVLDSGRFQTLASERSRAVVRSPPDPRTGLQITRELVLETGAARANLRRTMRNVSNRNVRWSLWDVTQLDCATEQRTVRPGCWMTIPVNATSRFAGGFEVLYGPADNPQWRMDRAPVFGVEYAGALGKVGLDSQAGWVAYSDPGGDWVLVHQFSVVAGAPYPDAGATIEVWTHGPGVAAGVDFDQDHLRGHFMEMEVLGPLVDLAPGAESSADLVWAACRCPGPIVDVTRAGCTGRSLQLQRLGDAWHVRGGFGVFAPGHVQLRALGSSTTLLERPAGPLEPIILDDDIALPQKSAGAELVAFDTTGAAAPIARAEVRKQGATS
jgi:hypothetical protein